MDSWKIIFVLIYVLCETNVSYQNLWPHAEPMMQEERRKEDVCQSFDMCATLNGICNYGRCKTHKCISEIYCVCDEGYTGHRCDQGPKPLDKVSQNDSKEKEPLHEASSSSQLNDWTFTESLLSHIQNVMTSIPESQIKHNSSFHKNTTESSRTENSQVWITTKSDETKADNASTNLVDNGTSISRNKSISEPYDEYIEGDHTIRGEHVVQTTTTQQSIQNESLFTEMVNTVAVQSSSASINAKVHRDIPTTGGHIIQTTSSPNITTNSQKSTGKATTDKTVVTRQSSSVVATISVVAEDIPSLPTQFESENNTQATEVNATQTEQFTTRETTSAEVLHNETKQRTPYVRSDYTTNIYTTETSINIAANKRRKFGTTVEYLDKSNNVRTIGSMLADVQEKTNTLVGPTPEQTPSTHSGSGHNNYSENTTRAKPLNQGIQFQTTESVLTNVYSKESTPLESTTYQQTFRDSGGVDNRSTNYTTIESYLDKRHHIRTSESALTEINRETSTSVETTTDQLFFPDSGREENHNTENMTIASLDKFNKIGTAAMAISDVNLEQMHSKSVEQGEISIAIDSLIVYNNTIKEHLSTDRTKTFVKSDVNNSYAAQNEDIVRNSLGTVQNNYYESTQKDGEFGPYIETGGSTNHESMSVASKEKTDSGSTQKVRTTNTAIGVAEHTSDSESDQNLRNEQASFTTDSLKEKAKSVELNGKNGMINMQYEKTKESSEEEQEVIDGGRSVEMSAEVSGQKTSVTRKDIIVTEIEKSRERPSKRTNTTMRKGYYNRVMSNIFVLTSVNFGQTQTETTTPTTRSDHTVDYFNRTTLQIFERNVKTAESTKHILNDMISDLKMMTVSERNPDSKVVSELEQKANIPFPDLSRSNISSGTNSTVAETITFTSPLTNQRSSEEVAGSAFEPVQSIGLNPFTNRTNTFDVLSVLSGNKDRTSINENDNLQQAQATNIHDHQIVFSTPSDKRHDHLNLITAMENISDKNLTTIGKEQMTDAVSETETFQDLKSTSVSSQRSDVDNKKATLRTESKMPQFLQYTRINETYNSNDNPDVKRKGTLAALDTTNSPLPQKHTVETYTTTSTKKLLGTEGADGFKDNSHKDGRVTTDVSQTSSPSTLTTTKKSTLPPVVLNNMYPDKSSLLEILRRLLLLEDTSFSPLHVSFTTLNGTESPDMTKASNTDKTTATVPEITRTTEPITFIAAESDLQSRFQTEEGQKHATQLKEGHLKRERTFKGSSHSTYKTFETSTTRPEIEKQLSKPAYKKAVLNALEMNDVFTRSSVTDDDQIHSKKAVNASDLRDGSQQGFTKGSLKSQPTESTIVQIELNETVPLTPIAEKNSEKYVTSFDDATVHSAIIQNVIPVTTLETSLSEINKGLKENDISWPKDIMENLHNEAHVSSSAISSPASPKLSTHSETSKHTITEHFEGNENISVPITDQFLENESYISGQVLSTRSNTAVVQSERTTNGQNSTLLSSEATTIDNTINPVTIENFQKGNNSAELLKELSTIMWLERLNGNVTENTPTGSTTNDNKTTDNYSDSDASNHSIGAGNIQHSVNEHNVSSINKSNAHIFSEAQTSRLSNIFSTPDGPHTERVTTFIHESENSASNINKEFTTSHSKIPLLPPITNSSKSISVEMSESNVEMDNVTVEKKMENTTSSNESQTVENQIGRLHDNADPHLRKPAKNENDMQIKRDTTLDSGIDPSAVNSTGNNIDNSYMNNSLVDDDFNVISDAGNATNTIFESKHRTKTSQTIMHIEESTAKPREQFNSSSTFVDKLKAFKLVNDQTESKLSILSSYLMTHFMKFIDTFIKSPNETTSSTWNG